MEKRSKYLTICYATAFIGGSCVMAVELIAGRLIARYIGVSLYTWTTVIGVVLAGISIGNFLGGRIADRYNPRRTLSALFLLASAACVLIPFFNNLMGGLPILMRLSWLVRITLHVALIFFLPSCVLGAISPVVAKLALDQGFGTGRTIGNIYAFSAAGSIFGTFITGFFFIAYMGSIGVVWTIAGVLGLVGLLYGVKTCFSYMWAAALIFLAFISLSPLAWAKTVATHLAITAIGRGDIIYEKDTQYSYISIIKEKGTTNTYKFMLDGLAHSKMNRDEPANLKFSNPYHGVFGGITESLASGKKDISVLILGGGGYVFPRYLEKSWPDGHIEVVEIDPGVTEAAIEVFGLPEENNMEIHHIDGRIYIEELIRQKEKKEGFTPFDFIYGDVIFGLAVPYHLTTYEFNEKIRKLLTPDGVYTVALVDSSDKSPQFLNAMISTLKRSFIYIYVVVPGRRERYEIGGYETFVIVASQEEIADGKFKFFSTGSGSRLLSEADLEAFRADSKEIVLTDDFAPVDNLLKKVFRIQGQRIICAKMLDSAERYIKEGKLEEAISQFQRVLRVDPEFVEVYSNIGSLRGWQARYDDAIEYYNKALDIKPGFRPAMIGLASALDIRDNKNREEK